MSDIAVDGEKAKRTKPPNDAPMLPRVRRPRRLKRVLVALRAATRPLTAADLGVLCDTTSYEAARCIRILRANGYTIQARRRNSPHATEYRLVEAPAMQRG